MKVSVVQRGSQITNLPQVVLMSREQAFERARQISALLKAYQEKMPRVFEQGITYSLDTRSGIRKHSYRDNEKELSIEGCARLIAKGQAIVNGAEEKMRARLSQYPGEVAQAMLSGEVKSGDLASLMKAMVDGRKKELMLIFNYIKLGERLQVRLQVTGHPTATVYIEKSQNYVSTGTDTIEGQYEFISHFNEIKERFLKMKEAITGFGESAEK